MKVRGWNGEHGVVSVGLAMLLAALPLSAFVVQDWYVDINAAGCLTGTGTQADPFCDIMDAVAAASDGDTIHIAPGTYFENVVLDEDLNLIGTDGEQVTILDGSASGSVVWVGAAEVTLTGLTLTNGSGTPWLSYGSSSLHGGGLFAYDVDSASRVTLTSCTVTGNSADVGGGLSLLGYDIASALIVSDCSVTANSAQCKGGGIASLDGLLILEGSTVTGNSGGGIDVHGGTITGSMINGNTGYGGLSVSGSSGVFNPGHLTLTNSTVNGNTPVGVFVSSSYLRIRDSTVNGNYGSGITGFAADSRLTNSTVNGNHGDGIGYVDAVTLTNSTVSNNMGDGIEGYYVTLSNSTVSGNVDFGLNLTGSGAVSNFISWDNGLGSLLWGGPGPYGYYSLAVDYSLIEGGWPGTGNIDADPFFVDPLNGDFSLLPGSPCIDAGDNLAVPLGIFTDLAGKRRFIDDQATPDTGRPGRLWPIVDMGAHEFGNDPPRKVRQR